MFVSHVCSEEEVNWEGQGWVVVPVHILDMGWYEGDEHFELIKLWL